MQALQAIIDAAFESRATLTPQTVSKEIKDAVNEVIHLLE